MFMTKTRALVRQWTLLRVLSQHAAGLSIFEMARHTSVNERTIRRDLKLFVEAGIPLRERVVRQNKKIWRIDYRGAMVAATFSAEDALALASAEHCLSSLKGTKFHSAMVRCRENVIANLSVNQRKLLNDKAERLQSAIRADASHADCHHAIASFWDGLHHSANSPEVDGSERNGRACDKHDHTDR
jgi:predicted DNA-binding transcriptional regulator YafY